jgi:hypothetical protein
MGARESTVHDGLPGGDARVMISDPVRVNIPRDAVVLWSMPEEPAFTAPLTDLQRAALEKLRPFLEVHGAQRLSRRLVEHGRFDIANAIEYAFKERRAGESALARAVAILGFTYEPAFDRSTTYEDDLDTLHELYLAGSLLTETGLRDAGRSALFHRAKKRSGGRPGGTSSWADVFHDMVEQFGPLDWRRFLHKLRPGMFELPSGEVMFFRGRWQGVDQRSAFVAVLRRLHDEGQNLSPGVMNQIPATEKIYSRITERGLTYKWDYCALVEEATGIPYAQIVKTRTGAKTYSPEFHRCSRGRFGPELVDHQRHASVPELVVDDALALLLGADEYAKIHAHDVQYSVLLRTTPSRLVTLPVSVPCPYTGTHSPRCDIVLFGESSTLVIEVLGGLEQGSDLARGADYEVKLRWKEACIRTYGRGALFRTITHETGEWGALAQQLQALTPLLDAAGIGSAGTRRPMSEVIERMHKHEFRAVGYFSYEEAVAYLVLHRITRWPDYLAACAREPRLPTNPHKVYRGSGWQGQPAYFEAARRSQPKAGEPA